jgi:hypothetical protein
MRCDQHSPNGAERRRLAYRPARKRQRDERDPEAPRCSVPSADFRTEQPLRDRRHEHHDDPVPISTTEVNASSFLVAAWLTSRALH